MEDVVFSRENVGGEITATISDEGIYLSSIGRMAGLGRKHHGHP